MANSTHKIVSYTMITFAKLVLCFLCCNNFAQAQGLLNNGAVVTVSTANYMYINGGLAIGNLKNQDAGASIGTIKNSGTIDVTGNWTNNSTSNVFPSNNGLVELIGTNQSIAGTTTTYFNNLNLLGSGIKTLNVNSLVGGGFATPAGVLALGSLPLDLNSYTLIINNPATTAITRTSGYIISETNLATNPSVIQWNVGSTNGYFLFPFGAIAAPNYIPLTITKSAGNTNISASTRLTTASDNQPWESTVTNLYSSAVGGSGEVPSVIDRWWNISSASTFTASTSFTYRGIENTTTISPTGFFAAQNWDGSAWLAPVGSGLGVTVGTESVTIPSQTMGGNTSTPWVLSSVVSPLPIELLYFKGTCNNSNVLLEWKTATELNNAYFTIETSNDGITFYPIANINGAGNSTSAISYQYTDDSNSAGIIYYKLKQTDYNGSFKYSSIISVENCNNTISNEFDFSIYPNPASNFLNINLSSIEVNALYSLKIVDALGQLVYQDDINARFTLLNTAQYSKGVYTIQITNNKKTLTKKLILAQ